jgi:hypothetical protein
MKPEEAIERINEIKTEIDNWRDSLGEKLSDREIKDIQAYDVALEALEKQIPKEPVDYDDCERFYIKCACGKIMDTRVFEKYCTRCGQALKL